MKVGTRVALAVGLGYVLGRRRQLRPALTLAAAVAVGRASHNAPSLVKYGSQLLGSSPALGELGNLGKPLATAGKAAATAAITSGVDALTERLRDRADVLGRMPGSQKPADSAQPEVEPKTRKRAARAQEPEEEPEEWDEDEEPEEEEEEPEEEEEEGDEGDTEEPDDEEAEDEADARGRTAAGNRAAARNRASAGGRRRGR